VVKKISAFYKTGIFFLAIVFSLGCVGITAASWSSDLRIKGLVATGNIDPVYTEATVAEYCGDGMADVSIHSGGKGILITMTEVYPGTYARIDYTVTNLGSIPVLVADDELNIAPGKKNEKKRKKWENVEAVYTFPQEAIGGNGGKGKGSIEIFVNNEGRGFTEDGAVAEAGDETFKKPVFKFDLTLVFTQWNAAAKNN